jgi:zinc transporter ZupT
MTCLNAFSGSVFLTVGLMHLLPHVLEYESAADLGTEYPVGLMFVVVGFLLILFVEQIVFNVHESANDLEREESRVQYTLLEKTKNVALCYREPLLTELAVVLHGVLEATVLGISVRRGSL